MVPPVPPEPPLPSFQAIVQLTTVPVPGLYKASPAPAPPLPPGLAKRGGDLPPGLEKQLIRKGHLPPGLEKKLYPFPVELERRLPPLRPGLVRGIIGESAVILDNRTKVILDIFSVW